jgi:hypothetical protein
MHFKQFRKKPTNLSREDALACRPVKNRDVLKDNSPEGLTVLTYPVQPRAWISALLKRFGMSVAHGLRRKLQLDDLGGEVWSFIDGRLRVKDIIEKFARTHGLTVQEAEPAVTHFLKELGKRGLIAMVPSPQTLGDSIRGESEETV